MKRQYRRALSIALLTVIVAWGAFFAADASGVGRRRAAPVPVLQLKAGMTASASLLYALSPSSEHRGALLIKAPADSILVGVRRYSRVLKQVYADRAIDFVLVDSSEKRGVELQEFERASSLTDVPSYTLLFDSSGRVRFSVAAVAAEDALRQLLSNVVGPAKLFPDNSVARWQRRLDSASFEVVGLAARAHEPGLRDGDVIAIVFDSHCDVCAINKYLDRVRAVRDSIVGVTPGWRAVLIVPPHYVIGAARPLLTSPDDRLLTTESILSLEMAYETRASSAAEPVGLFVRSGKVIGVAPLESLTVIAKHLIAQKGETK